MQDVELLIGHWDLGDLEECAEPVCPHGSLTIFKYGRIWRSCHELQMVTCVTAGRLCHHEKVIIISSAN